MTKVHAIVVAAGSGTRFGSQVPKQFLPLAGKPVVVRAIEALSPRVNGRMVIAISPDEDDRWRHIAREYALDDVIVAHGGSSRYQSVHNALHALMSETSADDLGGPALDGRHAEALGGPALDGHHAEALGGPALDGHHADALAPQRSTPNINVSPNDIILIHDGARPLPSQALIQAVIEGAQNHDGAIPAIPVTDSLRRGTTSHSDAVDRSRYFAVQTPQGFPLDRLVQAYHFAETSLDPAKPFTDDASVMEHAGLSDLVITPGDPRNIKITNPLDIEIAQLYLQP
ncbi:MAG: 2-C-methyl-D-erythritol 4-phosphate cytidylyltransferase [Bacteroidales bacterium]|nr:2-C-methyl-D-erythritol 4-phosphate cytidylyltransferase [Bacteroidales bacterium]